MEEWMKARVPVPVLESGESGEVDWVWSAVCRTEMVGVGLVGGFVPDVVLLYLSLVTMLVSASAFAMCPSVLELPGDLEILDLIYAVEKTRGGEAGATAPTCGSLPDCRSPSSCLVTLLILPRAVEYTLLKELMASLIELYCEVSYRPWYSTLMLVYYGTLVNSRPLPFSCFVPDPASRSFWNP
jgi:hypothetical protein